MLRRKNQEGFSLSELVIVMSILGFVVFIFATFFLNNYEAYLSMQQNTVRQNTLSSATQRVARVLRGINAITDAQPTTLTGYAYFTPRDGTLSKIRYFYDSSTRSLKVGVIAATGTAPNYVYDTSRERITTLVENIDTSTPIFKYLDIAGNDATFTADTFKDIKGIKITLKTDRIGKAIKAFELQTTVTLRNRKTNL